MKHILLILLVVITSCSQSTNEIIRHEVRLREARRGHNLTGLNVIKQHWVSDTLSVYYTANISFGSKDSTVQDSLFFIKSKTGALLPFHRNPQTDK